MLQFVNFTGDVFLYIKNPIRLKILALLYFITLHFSSFFFGCRMNTSAVCLYLNNTFIKLNETAENFPQAIGLQTIRISVGKTLSSKNKLENGIQHALVTVIFLGRNIFTVIKKTTRTLT